MAAAYFNTSYAEGAAAWDWPAEAKRLIEAHSWTTVDSEAFADCPSATIPVVSLAFNEDKSLVQITRSSYELSRDRDADLDVPVTSGSVDTCLLRRDPRNPEGWTLIGCKLDATS